MITSLPVRVLKMITWISFAWGAGLSARPSRGTWYRRSLPLSIARRRDTCGGSARSQLLRQQSKQQKRKALYDKRKHNSTRDQYDPNTFNRCGSTSQVWASWHADGAGPFGLYDLESCVAIRSARPDLAQSRSLCALERPCFNAPLVDSPPHSGAGG